MTDFWLWILLCVSIVILAGTLRGYATMADNERHTIPETDLIIANQQQRIKLGRAVTALRATSAALIAAGVLGLLASPWFL
jgi:hypothetical protein